MKKLLYLIAVLFVFSACTKNEISDVEPNIFLEDNQTEFNNLIGIKAKLSTSSTADCNCDFITGVAPFNSLVPSAWAGGAIGDLNFDGQINYDDYVILNQLLGNYEVNGVIGNLPNMINISPLYDYNQDGVINKSDTHTAMILIMHLREISGEDWRLTTRDLECFYHYLLGNLDC